MEQNMQNNINNNERDAFSELFREKLENHTVPVDVGSWDAIQAGMKTQKRKKVIPLWWFYSGAAVLVLLFAVGNFMFTDTERAIAKQVKVHKTVILKQNTIAVAQNKPALTNQTGMQTEKSVVVYPKQNSASIAVTEKTLPVETAPVQEELVVKPTEIIQEKAIAETNIVEERKSIEENQPDKLLANAEPQNDWTDPIKNDDSNDWVLMAGLGSGSSASVSGNPDVLVTDVSLKSSIVRAPTRNTTILSPSDFSNRTYSAPLSFGLRASKKINSKLGVETGLVYTYLQTNFTDSHVHAELSLHYLGIPVNLLFQLLKKQNWSIYGSAGMMGEKGLRSFYAQHEYVGSTIVTTTASTKVEGLQWSANVAAGATYNIFREFDIYLEPKFSYYFDSNQPISIRTDKKFAAGVEGGIRYNF